MFEDFENRSGFWKDLGSDFTINYSGLAPSFLTSGEMWQSMDSGTTQTLAAWEDGWVLNNNPDGTITANPKYTSGLPSETLTRVPVGNTPPTNTSPTPAGGGVVVAYNADENLLDGYTEDTTWTLKNINALCPDIGADEVCESGPFTQFTIRGTEGDAMDEGRWWWVNENTLGLTNYDGGSAKSGACEIEIRDGYMVKLKVKFETEGGYDFMDEEFEDIQTTSDGIIEKTEDSFTAIMKGGDKLSIDIDSDWAGTARFFLRVQGTDITHSTDHSIDDETYVTLLGVYTDTANPPDTDNGNGGNGGNGGLGGGGPAPSGDSGTNWPLWIGGAVALGMVLKVGGVIQMVFGHNVFGINGYGVGNQMFRAAGTADAFTGNKVKVFQHCMEDENFTDGWVKEWGEGTYDKDDFENDDASALWIPAGYTVVASQHFDHDDRFPGQQSTWEGPMIIECLADATHDFNDDISNFEITYLAPVDCSDENREESADGNLWTCGGCLSGYTEVSGLCVEEQTETQAQVVQTTTGSNTTVWVIGGVTLLGLAWAGGLLGR